MPLAGTRSTVAEHITRLRHLHTNVYEDMDEPSEPIFARFVESGEVQFWHQSFYGFLPESRVEIVTDGVALPDGAQHE